MGGRTSRPRWRSGHPLAPELLPYVLAQVVRAALPRLGGASERHPLAPCPGCRAEGGAVLRMLDVLFAGLVDHRVQAAWRESVGLCLAHLRLALPRAGPDGAATLMAPAVPHLAALGHEDGLLGAVAGTDPDRPRRAAAAALPTGDEAGRGRPPPVLDELGDDLDVPACPVCLVGGRAERRFLEWLAGEQRGDPARLIAEGAALCPRHLGDLADVDRVPAVWAADLQRERAVHELDRLGRQLAGLPPRFPRPALGRRRAWDPEGPDRHAGGELPAFRHRRALFRAAVQPFVNTPTCPACRATSEAETRRSELLVAALALGPVAHHYEASHGFCLGHTLRLSRSPAGPLLTRIATGRAGVLAWELEEADRKRAWSARHQARGDESTAWRRAAVWLDGHVLLGGPPAWP